MGNKNYLKVLGLSALIGGLIDVVYRIGIKEGKQQLVDEITYKFIPKEESK